jgi:hypothetical protein
VYIDKLNLIFGKTQIQLKERHGMIPFVSLSMLYKNARGTVVKKKKKKKLTGGDTQRLRFWRP